MSSENEMWPVRATAWELAAFSFRHPTHELARAITSGEWFDAACEIGDALGVILPEDFGKGLPSPSSSIEKVDEDGFFHRLRAEATRLFMGPGEPACSPYEGVWRAKAEGVKPLLFVNPHSVEVERFVKDHGFTRPEGTNEPLDHVATECELLQAFAMRAMADSGSSEAYVQFLEKHLRVWIDDFCAECQNETSEPFYKAAAIYLETIAKC